MNIYRCGWCAYWEDLGIEAGDNEGTPTGYCRRSPPIKIMRLARRHITEESRELEINAWSWPITKVNDWCGESQKGEVHSVKEGRT